MGNIQKTYNYQGYVPRTDIEKNFLDGYVARNFTGNVVEEILKEHLAEFSILTENNAKLFFNNVVGFICFYKDM